MTLQFTRILERRERRKAILAQSREELLIMTGSKVMRDIHRGGHLILLVEGFLEVASTRRNG